MCVSLISWVLIMMSRLVSVVLGISFIRLVNSDVNSRIYILCRIVDIWVWVLVVMLVELCMMILVMGSLLSNLDIMFVLFCLIIFWLKLVCGL